MRSLRAVAARGMVLLVIEEVAKAPTLEEVKAALPDFADDMATVSLPPKAEHNPWTHGAPRHERRRAAALARRAR